MLAQYPALGVSIQQGAVRTPVCPGTGRAFAHSKLVGWQHPGWVAVKIPCCLLIFHYFAISNASCMWGFLCKMKIGAFFHDALEMVVYFRMKLNISFPTSGCQKLIEVDDECKLSTFYEKCLAAEGVADTVDEEWKGYVVWTSGGNDKQVLPMKQGVLTHGHVCLLLSQGHFCYRPMRTGERKHKSVWGCTVDVNLNGLNLVIVKERGEELS